MNPILVMLLPVIEQILGALGTLVVAYIQRMASDFPTDGGAALAVYGIVADLQAAHPAWSDHDKREFVRTQARERFPEMPESTINRLIEASVARLQEERLTSP